MKAQLESFAVVASAIALIPAIGLGQEYAFTAADVEEGRRTFMASCATCHGPDGDAIAGSELNRETLARASTDELLRAIMREGIPGTAMPPANLNPRQVDTLVAFIRSMGSLRRDSDTGDPDAGREFFRNTGCLDCHRVRGEGGTTGPDLGTIGLRRTRAELERSVMDPQAEVLPENRTFVVITTDDETIRGRILNQGTESVQLLSLDGLVSVLRSDIRRIEDDPESPMPSYENRITQAELDDLIAYLVSLQGLE